MRRYCLILFLCLALISMGCASERNPVTPSPGPSTEFSAHQAHAGAANRHLLGLWTISIPADRNNPVIVPDRAACMHLNVTKLLEDPAYGNCLTISGVEVVQPNELILWLTLTHPFPELLNYMGFDVRGILITGADYSFPDSERQIAQGDEYLRLLNYDGYTSLFNPTEFPEGGPRRPILSYITGKYAMGGDLSTTLCPFVAYKKHTERRIFFDVYPHKEAHYVHLALPEGPLEFGYAIDACWAPVDGEINDPIEDYPPEANCLEAYEIAPQINPILPPDNSGTVYVEVYDHQGLDTISQVFIEVPDLFDGTVTLEYHSTLDDERSLFYGIIYNYRHAENGDYPALIKVTDTTDDLNLGPICAWDVTTVRVGPKDGWARTWGGDAGNIGTESVAADDSGNVYVAGMFFGPMDFYPGPGIDERVNNGTYSSCYIARYDSAGNYQGVSAWGSGDYLITAEQVTIDSMGNAYVVGLFDGTVDFDPGPSRYEKTTNGDYDCYITKFDPDGNFLWAQTWGGDLDDHAYDVAVDEFDSVYIAGAFRETVDFDPGPEPEEITATGPFDCFLVRYGSDGTYDRVRTWGGPGSDNAGQVTSDHNGSVYVGGTFNGTIDLDPGPDVDEHTATDGSLSDVYLSRFDSDGNFIWANTWGGELLDQCNGIDADTSGCYFTGTCSSPTDFDPGPGIEDGGIINGGMYVSSFSPDGLFNWVTTWESATMDILRSTEIAINETGGPSLSGYFHGIMDLDPGPSVDEHKSWPFCDFLLKLDQDGSVIWSNTWTGTGAMPNIVLAVTDSGDTYLTDSFWGRVDFDPGPGTEWRTAYYTSSFLLKCPPDGTW